MYKHQNKDFEDFRQDAIIKMLPRVGKPEVASVVIKPLTKQESLPMTPYTNVSDRADHINKFAYLNAIPSCEQLKLIKKQQVLAIACISKSTLHLKVIDGLFPPSIALGERAVAFVEHEILAVVTAQIQGKSKDEIRSLVKNLVAQRQDLT